MKEKVCTLLFLIRDGEVLLAMKKRGFGAGRYNGVGGKVNPDETIEEALIRECREEIDVTPIHYWQVGEHDFLQTESSKPWRMYAHIYLCDKWEGEPTESEEMTPEWYKFEDVPYDTMWQDDILWLPQVLGGDKIQAKFTFDEKDNMLTQDIRKVNMLPNELKDEKVNGSSPVLAQANS